MYIYYTKACILFRQTSIAEEGLCKTVCCSITTCMLEKMELCKNLI